MIPRNWQPAVAKFEFLVVVALIGVLAAILLDRLITIQAEAERLAVSLTIRNMRTGLQLAIGERLMRGREDTLRELLSANPVTLLVRPPDGYVGDAAAPAGAGSWRYDASRGVLEYRPHRPDAFEGRTALRWRLVARGDDGLRVRGLRLEPESE